MQKILVANEDKLIDQADADVRNFLRSNPICRNSLLKGVALARKRFPGNKFELSLFIDPEESINQFLCLEIHCEDSPREFMDRFDRFLKSEWLDIFMESEGNILASPVFE
ncbi:MAG: hypothetical protein HRF49_11985 [bacterium]|jgi:hypothetical protein